MVWPTETQKLSTSFLCRGAEFRLVYQVLPSQNANLLGVYTMSLLKPYLDVRNQLLFKGHLDAIQAPLSWAQRVPLEEEIPDRKERSDPRGLKLRPLSSFSVSLHGKSMKIML
jgi:hypothetical protein